MGNQPWPQFQSGIRERSIVKQMKLESLCLNDKGQEILIFDYSELKRQCQPSFLKAGLYLMSVFIQKALILIVWITLVFQGQNLNNTRDSCNIVF